MSPLRLVRWLYRASGLQGFLPLSVKTAVRRSWIRVARAIGYPISSPLFPRPAVARRAAKLRLTDVVVATDLNPRYLDLWPLIKRTWPLLAGLEPTLVLVAAESDVPHELRADEHVRVFEPIEGLHTAFQAQCIRLLYPGMMASRGAVLISDADLLPLAPGYFHDSLAGVPEDMFVSYRGDVMLHRREIAICYNAARPDIWAELFAIEDEGDVRARLVEWASGLDYSGARGGSGWYTDQHVLYETVLPWGRRTDRLWVLDDEYTGYLRLDRSAIERDGLTEADRRTIAAQGYSDYHCCIPYAPHRETNALVVDLAAAALR